MSLGEFVDNLPDRFLTGGKECVAEGCNITTARYEGPDGPRCRHHVRGADR